MFGRTLFQAGFILAVGCLLIFNGQDAAAQSIPSGSYQQSCNRINVKGHRLSAYCRAKDGSESLTTLNNFDLCESEIGNNDGTLTCKKPILPALKVRASLYYLGGQSGSITKQTRVLKQNSTETIPATEAENCNNGSCKYYFGLIVDRKSAKDSLSPYASISVKNSGAGGGGNVFFKPGEYKGDLVVQVPLKVGANTLEVIVDPENKIREDNKVDNRFTVKVIVKQ